ncbi:hypothetical protein ACR79H_07810 [Sphingobacterium spiritivorum]|uniref:hypothetical protein n=1 Tax=Sphingobacterium spiritivorum TaxID=258 RepID=UPI003DA54C3C
MQKIALHLLGFLLVIGCSKDDSLTDKKEPRPQYPSQDLGIVFTSYEKDKTYGGNDTIRNNFAITNYGPADLAVGDTLKLACRIGGVLWALDLIGEGPTNHILEENLKVGQQLDINPGYLLGHTILEYFNVDNVDLCIMIYGVNSVITNETFASDPKPENNKVCLNYRLNTIKLN